MVHIFSTSESDTMSITRDESGQYYERRYGLPKMKINYERIKVIAWLECNRRGMFLHLKQDQPDGIPTLTNPAAQQFIIKHFLREN